MKTLYRIPVDVAVYADSREDALRKADDLLRAFLSATMEYWRIESRYAHEIEEVDAWTMMGEP
jgi:hypothetical protein